MKKNFLLLFLSVFVLFSCQQTKKGEVPKGFVTDNYTKIEVDIPMRDGVKLHTTIYSPKDKEIPLLLF